MCDGMTTAEDRGWGPGWPHCQTSNWVDLEVLSLRGKVIRFPAHRIRSDRGTLVFEEAVGFPGGVHEDIADLVSILLRVSEHRGYINLQPGWCWGAACRPIKRPDGTLTDTPSNHSWGLALDINAPENGFGAATHTIPVDMARLWNDYGFGWGGDYSGAKDWMHMEQVGSPGDVVRYTRRARRELLPEIEEAEMSPEQEAMLKRAAAFIDTLTEELKPGKDEATVSGAAQRVAAAVKTVEREKAATP